MICAKNNETVSTFVEVMQKKTVASFFSGHGVVTRYRKWQLYNVKYQYTILATATTVASVDEALSAHFAVPPVVIHPFRPLSLRLWVQANDLYPTYPCSMPTCKNMLVAQQKLSGDI